MNKKFLRIREKLAFGLFSLENELEDFSETERIEFITQNFSFLIEKIKTGRCMDSSTLFEIVSKANLSPEVFSSFLAEIERMERSLNSDDPYNYFVSSISLKATKNFQNTLTSQIHKLCTDILENIESRLEVYTQPDLLVEMALVKFYYLLEGIRNTDLMSQFLSRIEKICNITLKIIESDNSFFLKKSMTLLPVFFPKLIQNSEQLKEFNTHFAEIRSKQISESDAMGDMEKINYFCELFEELRDTIFQNQLESQITVLFQKVLTIIFNTEEEWKKLEMAMRVFLAIKHSYLVPSFSDQIEKLFLFISKTKIPYLSGNFPYTNYEKERVIDIFQSYDQFKDRIIIKGFSHLDSYEDSYAYLEMFRECRGTAWQIFEVFSGDVSSYYVIANNKPTVSQLKDYSEETFNFLTKDHPISPADPPEELYYEDD